MQTIVYGRRDMGGEILGCLSPYHRNGRGEDKGKENIERKRKKEKTLISNNYATHNKHKVLTY